MRVDELGISTGLAGLDLGRAQSALQAVPGGLEIFRELHHRHPILAPLGHRNESSPNSLGRAFGMVGIAPAVPHGTKGHMSPTYVPGSLLTVV